jgi:hypothetical protein
MDLASVKAAGLCGVARFLRRSTGVDEMQLNVRFYSPAEHSIGRNHGAVIVLERRRKERSAPSRGRMQISRLQMKRVHDRHLPKFQLRRALTRKVRVTRGLERDAPYMRSPFCDVVTMILDRGHLGHGRAQARAGPRRYVLGRILRDTPVRVAECTTGPAASQDHRSGAGAIRR